MELEEIKKIGVAGAGTMGAGIAQISSMSGFDVILYDVKGDQLEIARANIEKNIDGAIKRGKLEEIEKEPILKRIKYSEKSDELIADVVIEAIVENLEVKKELFDVLAYMNKPDAILASNTSTIPITQIAKGVAHPGRVVGMHFFNPVHIMKLVEVIAGTETSADVAFTIKGLAEKMGKRAVLATDSPGFIVNRVARHFYVESLKVLEEGVADHETIDTLVESAGFRMGPFKLMDLIGVDTNYAVTETMYTLFNQDPKFRPSRIQKQKVDAGNIGRKSGKGFYNYSD